MGLKQGAVFLVMFSFVSCATGSRFSNLMMVSSKPPYSVGNSILGSLPPFCWCGPHSTCLMAPGNGTKHCSCWDGYEGTPPHCRPSPELWATCFEGNPCGPNSECSLVNGTRHCECMVEFEGSPPNCRLPTTKSEGCNRCGPNSACHPFLWQQCACLQGFVGEPPICTAGPELLALCDPYPCGGFAECRMRDGAPVCSCLPGYVGAPPDCHPRPETWRVCFKDRPCGFKAKCWVEERAAVCSACPDGRIDGLPNC